MFTLIVQLWPEPIEETFRSVCDFELPENVVVTNRSHSYSNWRHGVWYTDHGTVTINPIVAKDIDEKLRGNSKYKSKGNTFEKFIVGEILATCSASSTSGVIEYDLVLW